MGWCAADKAQLDSLLSFVIDLAKAKNRCHVMMVTSEYAFQDWLSQGDCEHNSLMHGATHGNSGLDAPLSCASPQCCHVVHVVEAGASSRWSDPCPDWASH